MLVSSDSWNSRTTCITHIKETIKYFLFYIREWQTTIIKNTKKDSEKEDAKNIKIFLRKKKIKSIICRRICGKKSLLMNSVKTTGVSE